MLSSIYRINDVFGDLVIPPRNNSLFCP